MPGVSIHVVDVARGVVGTGMRVELYATTPRRLVASGAIGAKGLLEHEGLGATFAAGTYEAVFHVAEWYRAQRVALPQTPFLDVVSYRFGIGDPAQHYHLPFKCTPWGYSCFRGGA
ncbi:MAG: hydroxyisourate hydrolase [Betaproteobacteria bacterium]|nr:hydroxyisourate hydrolase [Betaproteobacteria bacterium]